MLEYVSLILSLFFLAYCIRLIIFIQKSYEHQMGSSQVKRWSLKSTFHESTEKTKIDYSATHNKGLVLFNDSKKQMVQTSLPAQFTNHKNAEPFVALNSTESQMSSEHARYDYHPVISLMIATRNEEPVISELLKSLDRLTYDRTSFEIIVVDDSDDSTYGILQEWQKRIENLRVIKTTGNTGWKGGALNLGLEYLRKDSSWVIIIDADTILPPNFIEQFLGTLLCSNKTFNAIQGYCIPYNNDFCDHDSSNWISKGVELRLAQRNLIEFVAREKLSIPLQITGSLFIIKSSIIKEIGFSTDLCEDWNLTLQLYIREYDNMNLTAAKDSTNILSKANIRFDEKLNASSQTPTSLSSYFKQRLRVSEGHTRAFVKMLSRILLSEQPFKNKVEIFLTGLMYFKYVFLPVLILLDIYSLVASSGVNNMTSVGSLSLQVFCLTSIIMVNIMAMLVLKKQKQYDFTFLLSKLLLDICVLPALIVGSLLGVLRSKGTFYKTERIAAFKKSI